MPPPSAPVHGGGMCSLTLSRRAASQRLGAQFLAGAYCRPGAHRPGGVDRVPAGASQTPSQPWAPRGLAASFLPSLPPLLVFIDPPSLPPPPPPPSPTIRFIKSPFVSQEAGEREGERDAEAGGGGGCLRAAPSCLGPEGKCRRWGRGCVSRTLCRNPGRHGEP